MPTSLKRLLKEYFGILQEFAQRGELNIRQATASLYLLHRIGTEQIGVNALTKALNSRLLALFDETLAIEQDQIRERESVSVAKEILKTPFRPLHIQLIQKIAELQTEDCPRKLIYKALSFWQR